MTVVNTVQDKTLEQMNLDSILQPCTSISDHLQNGPIVMKHGKGIRVTDHNGREYIDGASGLWCVNVGYGREEIAEAVRKQTLELGYFHSFTSMSNEHAIRLADKVMSMVPSGMNRIFWGSSGSDANDTIIKLVWYYNNLLGRPQKKKIIARERAYHGITVASGSCTNLPINNAGFDLPLPGFLHTRSVDMYRGKPEGMSEEDFSAHLAAKLEEMILAEGPDTVAAFIAEPIQGTGGILPPPQGYFQAIQKVLDKYDVLMIADEVIDGFGRLGANFGSDVYGIKPDFMTLAKGLSSGYQPISGAVIGDRVWEVLKEKSTSTYGGFGHGYTYSAHPVCAAGALANLEIMERENLKDNAATVGAELKARLEADLADNPLVGDIRGLGLKIGIELVADRTTRQPLDAAIKCGPRIMAQGYEEGIICRALPHRDVIGMSPPLIMTSAEAEEYAAGVVRAINTVTAQVQKELG